VFIMSSLRNEVSVVGDGRFVDIKPGRVFRYAGKLLDYATSGYNDQKDGLCRRKTTFIADRGHLSVEF
jgi:hypothetical protein